MTPEMAVTFIILAGAVILFVTNRLPVDLVALLVLSTLIITRLVTVEEAFAGFSNPAVVTVWSVFIVGAAVQRSGVADLLAARMLHLAGNSEWRLLLVLMTTSALISSVMNNVGAVAILLPPTMAMARKLNQSPSRFLMPVAFASLLGGNLTLIGTPPNILAADLVVQAGLQPLQFFDFTPMGVAAIVVGMGYMLVFGRYLLPNRDAGGSLASSYPLQSYLVEVQLKNNSPLIGQSIEAIQLGKEYQVNIVQIRRGAEQILRPLSDRLLQAGDVLLLEGALPTVMAVSKHKELQIVTDFSAEAWPEKLDSQHLHLSEIAIAPRSIYEGKTVRELEFRNRLRITVLALRHRGHTEITNLNSIPLEVGDVLLVQGSETQLRILHQNTNLLVLTQPEWDSPKLSHAILTVGVLVAVVAIAALNILHIAAAMFIGAVILVLGRTMTMAQAYRAIDWRAVFLIAAMLPLGGALERTGGARYIAETVIGRFDNFGPLAILAVVFILTALLTEVVSNAATTVLVVPIAIEIALGLGSNPYTFVMATVLAASTSFLTPVGHQCNVIIFGPGGYQFSDYARVGVGLNVLMLLVAVLVVPLIWPL
ncbi:MAG: SLC13 family permease [Anaerolineae bacterium]|nr:SLC13 family permease [Anaerolineae bacterium]MCO5204666.1 SLC13 family permease [Anaerolineae bacterium]